MSWGWSAPVVGRGGTAATGPGAGAVGVAVEAPGVVPPAGAPNAPAAGRGAVAAGPVPGATAPRSWRFTVSSFVVRSSTRPDRVVEAVDLASERGDLSIVLAGLLAHALVDLRRDAVSLTLATLGRLRRHHLLTELQQILLGGNTGRFLHLGAARQRQGDEKAEPSHRR